MSSMFCVTKRSKHHFPHVTRCHASRSRVTTCYTHGGHLLQLDKQFLGNPFHFPTFQHLIQRSGHLSYYTFNNPCSPFPSTPSLIRLDKSVFVRPFLHNPHLELIVTEFVNQPEITEKTLQSQHIGIYIRHTVETFLKNASFDVRSYICLSFNKMHSEDSFQENEKFQAVVSTHIVYISLMFPFVPLTACPILIRIFSSP